MSRKRKPPLHHVVGTPMTRKKTMTSLEASRAYHKVLRSLIALARKDKAKRKRAERAEQRRKRFKVVADNAHAE